jgi:lysyl-tRNA synthetase class 2
MMKLVEELVSGAAQEVCGTLLVGKEGQEKIDLTPPWRVATYRDLVLEKAGADWFEKSVEAAREWARAQELDVPNEMTHTQITHEVYDKLVEKTLLQPTFVTRLPAELVPLAKRCEDDPSVVDVFELVVRGRELCPGYTELNDPLDQRARLEEQAAGDASKIDEDFLRASSTACRPPAAWASASTASSWS